MEDRKTITIAIALSAAMVLMFIGVILYAKLRRGQTEENADLVINDTEVITDETAVLPLEDESAFHQVEVQVYTVDDADVDKEDSAINETVVENTYINTTPLLPSVYNEREKVLKAQVDVSGFPDSYALNETKSLEIEDSKISVPKEVYLYNTGIEKSSQISVEATVEDADGIIKSIGWNSTNPSVIQLSNSTGTRVDLEYIGDDFSGKVPVSIIVTYQSSPGNTATKELLFNVFVEDISYGNEQLCDKSGNLLYLDKKGKKAAYVSDYASNDYFTHLRFKD